jgi:hypothetical protein
MNGGCGNMNRLYAVIVTTGVALVAATCSVTGPTTQSLRIHNTGSADIQGLALTFPGSQVAFGNVSAGSTTGYLEVPGGVYSYAAFQFVYQDSVEGNIVIDWVGEEPLTGKRFTYTVQLVSMSNDIEISHVGTTKDQ